jgi:hypothetical protein
MRYKFDEIFQENPNRALTPKVKIFINGVSFGPGVIFSPGVIFGGVDIFQHKGRDIEADDQGGILMLKGFYDN